MKIYKLTYDRLHELLEYEPKTGLFKWNRNAGRYGRIPSGSIAGCTNKIHGYTEIWCDKVLYKSHRLAWLYMTGKWPEYEIDHINRIRNDNRWCNLREVTLQQNLQNKNIYKNNTSGFVGVTWHKYIKKWQTRIGNGTNRYHLGYWDNIIDAANAYVLAKKRNDK